MFYSGKNNGYLKVSRPAFMMLVCLLFMVTGVHHSRGQKAGGLSKPQPHSQLAVRQSRYLSAETLKRLEKPAPAKKSSPAAQLSPQKVAQDFLQNNRGWFGIKKAADELNLTAIRTSPAGQHLAYAGIVQDIPVHNSMIVITVNNSGDVSFIMSNFRPDLQLKNVEVRLSAAGASEKARDFLKVSGFMHAEPESRLMVFETAGRGAVLAYRVRLPVPEPLGDWQLFVDASTAEILEVTNALCYQSGVQGSGAVWIPDPLTMAGKYFDEEGFSDNNDQDNDSLNNQRVIVPLYDLGINGESGDFTLIGPHIKINDSLYVPIYKPAASSDLNGFVYTRSQQEFEDVMVYYHGDQSYRRLLELGFPDSTLTDLAELQADPHGSYDDNSFYSPFGNFCAFGEGGVDDAEDAAVIWHEYTHAIQRNLSMVQFPGRDETFSLLEGAADYWAASYKRRISGFDWPQVFLWDAGIRSDGDTTFWSGRRCDLDWHYPEDYQLVAGTHNGGQIWSSALMHIWSDLGADITDALFIQSHYYWSQNPGFRDAAEAIIQADRDLYGASHLAVLTTWFDYHGFIDRAAYLPAIIHQTRRDSEDLIGPYLVECQIQPGEAALDPAALWLIWQRDSLEADSTRLNSVAPDNYAAEIPGSGDPAAIHYYFYARDVLGQSAVHPAAAPAERHLFHTGPDTLSPVIQHTALADQILSTWPAEIIAVIDDNLGIDSVWAEYRLQPPDSLIKFYLQAGDSGLYRGYFLPDSSGIQDGDSVHYRIVARDLAVNKNQSCWPAVGFSTFILYHTPRPPQHVQVLEREDLVRLAWEENKQKVPVYYKIYKAGEDLAFSFLDSVQVPEYTDTTVVLGGTYFYYLTTVFAEWESLPSDTVQAIVEAVVSLDGNFSSPRVFKLGQNYPNPFNPKTIIHYELPAAHDVKLDIYNLLGQRVAILVSERQAAGRYQVEWNAATIASGIYYYRLQAGPFSQVRKLILLK